MGIKVAKFGGTSMADGIQLSKVKQIIESDKDRKYVVVSAPGKRYDGDSKITDLLYLCKTHIEHNLPYEQVFQVICDRFVAIKMSLELKVDLQKEFDTIKQNLEAGASADYIASRGEYLTALIMAEYLGYEFIDGAEVILFDAKGRFLAEETNKLLGERLKKHERAVVPGFYGKYPDGSIKTFSRGGSDVTGAIVARATNADVYENWTDVSGFLMADPKIVKNPKPIESLSYKELRELSYMGAAVLHEDAIAPARAVDIPINIRNTNQPEDQGTIITAEEIIPEDRIITGIAGTKGFIVIGLYKNNMNAERGILRRVLGILDDYDVLAHHLPSGIDTVSVVIEAKSINGRLDELIEDIKNNIKPDAIDIAENIALIATVGCGMANRKGVSARLFTALAEAGVNIRMIDQGSSEMNIIIGVESEDFETSIRAIYSAFVS